MVRYIKGKDLTPEQRRQVLNAFVYRNTYEHPHPESGGKQESDEQYLKRLAFPFTNDGKRITEKPRHAVPEFLAKSETEIVSHRKRLKL